MIFFTDLPDQKAVVPNARYDRALLLFFFLFSFAVVTRMLYGEGALLFHGWSSLLIVSQSFKMAHAKADRVSGLLARTASLAFSPQCAIRIPSGKKEEDRRSIAGAVSS